MTTLAFLDTETTGLDPDRHEVWEIGLILRRPDRTDQEYVWQLPVDLGQADPIALNIGRFHDRRASVAGQSLEDPVLGRPAELTAMPVGGLVRVDALNRWADQFVALTRGSHLVGAVVSFDADRLWRLLRSLDQCPMWHYHLVDVEALAAGYLAGQDPASVTTPDNDKCQPPWSSEELSRAVGVDPEDFDRHSALGDARWAKAIYDAVINQ